MKRIIFLILFSVLILPICAQTHFEGFFRKVKENQYFDRTRERTADRAAGVLLFRPVFQLTAAKFVPTGDERVFEISSLSSFGTGLAYNHYLEQTDGTPYLNYGASLLILFDQKIADVAPAGLSVALTFTGFQFISAGVGYSFPLKKPFILTGLSYSF